MPSGTMSAVSDVHAGTAKYPQNPRNDDEGDHRPDGGVAASEERHDRQHQHRHARDAAARDEHDRLAPPEALGDARARHECERRGKAAQRREQADLRVTCAEREQVQARVVQDDRLGGVGPEAVPPERAHAALFVGRNTLLEPHVDVAARRKRAGDVAERRADEALDTPPRMPGRRRGGVRQLVWSLVLRSHGRIVTTVVVNGGARAAARQPTRGAPA